MSTTAELPLEAGANAEFTRDQALEWLAANPGATVRKAAAAWGWSKTRAHKLMSQCPADNGGTNAGQDTTSDGTAGHAHEMGTSDAGQDGTTHLVPKLTTDDGRPIVGAPYTDDFNWDEDETVFAALPQAMAVYCNHRGLNSIVSILSERHADSLVRVKMEKQQREKL